MNPLSVSAQGASRWLAIRQFISAPLFTNPSQLPVTLLGQMEPASSAYNNAARTSTLRICRLEGWATTLRLWFCLLLAGSVMASAQMNVIGPPPVTPTAARDQIRALLNEVDAANRQQTVTKISGLLTWYRELVDDELIAAWKGYGRPNLPEVIESLADSHLASAIVEFSWRQQREATFIPSYAPVLGHLMARYPESAKPFLDDLLGPSSNGQAPLDLSQPEAEAVCRILLDMPDLGTWKRSALQILPHYHAVVDNLLAQDIRGNDKEKSYAAQRWLAELKFSDPGGLNARNGSEPVTPPRLVPPPPATPRNGNRQSSSATSAQVPATHAGVVLTPLNPLTSEDTLRSLNFATPAVIDFVNHSNRAIDIYWMTYEGGRRLERAGLPVNATWRETTFLTHPFLVIASGTGGTLKKGTGLRLAAFQAVTPRNGPDASAIDTAIITNSDGPTSPESAVHAPPQAPGTPPVPNSTVLTPLNPDTVDDTLASVTGLPAAFIDFVNRTNGPVDIYWINFKGDRVLYRAALPVGATWSGLTGVKHFWLVVASGTGGTAEQDSGTRLAGFAAVTPRNDSDPSARNIAIITNLDGTTTAQGANNPCTAADGGSPPSPIRRAEAEYSQVARKLLVMDAIVRVSFIVQPDGSATDFRVTRSGGYGLDEKWIEAVRRWKFQPGMKDGKPLSCRASAEMHFTLGANTAPGQWSSAVMSFADESDVTKPVVRNGTMPKPIRDNSDERAVFEFTVDASGSVKNVHLLQGDATSTELLSNALSTWKFWPAMKGHEPTEATGQVAFVKGLVNSTSVAIPSALPASQPQRATDTQAPPRELARSSGGSVISVVSATYGSSCGQPIGNQTANLARACDGKQECRYTVDFRAIGDPAPMCRKDYIAEWACGGVSYRDTLPPEAGNGSVAGLFCGKPGSPLSTSNVNGAPGTMAPLALYTLSRDGSDATGLNHAFSLTNTSFRDGALYLNGAYIDRGGYTAIAAVPALNYEHFTAVLEFKAEAFDAKRSAILYAGQSYRSWGLGWRDGVLELRLNNNTFRHAFAGAELGTATWHQVICSVDLSQGVVRTLLDGRSLPDVQLPPGFRLDVIGTAYEAQSKQFTFTDYSNGTVFQGYVRNLGIYGNSFSEEELQAIYRSKQDSTLARVPTATDATGVQISPDAAGWEIVQNSNSADLFEQFLKEYPNSPFAGAARLKLAVLKRTPAAGAQSGASDSDSRNDVYNVGNGVSKPEPLNMTPAEYSDAARNQKIGGVVVLQIVVDAQGNVVDAKINRGLGFGLDEKAIEAVRRWKFKPGYKDGMPVAVSMAVEVGFRVE